MEDKLFDSQSKKEAGVIAFTELVQHPGWVLFTQILDANIKVTQDLLSDSTTEHTKEGDDSLREKLNLYKKMKNTPHDMIKELSAKNEGIDPLQELDPYPVNPRRN